MANGWERPSSGPNDNVLVVLLLDGEEAPSQIASAVASIARQNLVNTELCALASPLVTTESRGRLATQSGIPFKSQDELLDSGGILAFLRGSDHWREGSLESRLRTFTAHPLASFGVAGYVLVDELNRDLLTVLPPPLPIDPLDVLLRPRVEASSVLVRASALTASDLDLISAPRRASVVWSRLAQMYGVHRSGEVAAEVMASSDFPAVINTSSFPELLDALARGQGTEVTSELRREALRRIFSAGAGVDVRLTDILPPIYRDDELLLAICRDIEWAIDLQHRANAQELLNLNMAAIEERPVLEREDPDDDRTIKQLMMSTVCLGSEIARRDAKIRHLEMELRLLNGPAVGTTSDVSIRSSDECQ